MESGDAPQTPPAADGRTSKFKEATMNSTASIHPPPDELWRGLGVDHLIDKFNDENSAPPAQRRATTAPGPSQPSYAPAAESAFSRFSRAVASLFRGSGASSLGKRKADSETAERDDRKRRAEAAYAEAKATGLLPQPQVFVRPAAQSRKSTTHAADTPTPTFSGRDTPTPRPPSNKKDLLKQKKLSKRVSDLEFKLAEARKELNLTLGGVNTPPVPPLPAVLSAAPSTSPARSTNAVSEGDISPSIQTDTPATGQSSNLGKITKKRKASPGDGEYKPVPTDSDVSIDSEREIKRSKTLKKKRSSARINKGKSSTAKQDVFTIVPDGVAVPPIPDIPSGVDGKRAAIRDDGFGGLGHEIF